MLTPPPWPALLELVAILALAWEVRTLAAWCRRRWGAAGLALAAISLVAGALLAVGAGLLALSGAAGVASARRGLVLRAGLWGSALAAVAAMTLAASGPGQCGALVTLGAAAVAWSIRSYARTTSPIRPSLKWVLLGLRIAAILLAVAWSLGVSLAYTRDERVESVLLVGVDTSGSMDRRDVPSATGSPGERVRRIDAARLALQGCADEFRRIARQGRVQWFTFDAGAAARGDLNALQLSALGQAGGIATAIGDAAADALDQQAPREVRAILLLSDGCNNTADRFAPEKFAELMGARGVPIYTAGVGSTAVTGGARNLAVRDLACPDEVEAFNRLPIAAAVEAVGLAGGEVEVVCRFADQEVSRQRLRIKGDHDRQAVQMTHVPLAAGYHRLIVEARLLGRDPSGLTGPLQADKLVHVTNRSLRLLYVEGKFRYEAKYILQALAGDRRIAVDRRVLWGSTPGAALSEKVEDYLAYHAILLGDVDAHQFTPAQLAIFRDLVDKYGKGLGMIGGAHSFGRGSWQDTPLADVMPVDLPHSEMELPAPVRVVPTPEADQSELMKIAPDGSDFRAAWKHLPALSGANRLGPAKPAAVVLARSEAGDPLIVAQQFGKGRSLAIAFDTTWNWVLTPQDTAELQRRFWRQVAMYLANAQGNIWITTDRTRYDLDRLDRGAESILATAGVEDARGRPMPEAPVTITLRAPDASTTPVSLPAQQTMRGGKIGPVKGAGSYRLKIEAAVEGRKLSAEHQFEVVRRDLEAMDVLANPALLENLAKLSGGRYAPVGELKELLKTLAPLMEPRKVPVTEHRNLSDELSWPILIAFVTLLCAEWAIRKKKGLV